MEGRGVAGEVFALARQGDWIKWQLKQEQCEESEKGGTTDSRNSPGNKWLKYSWTVGAQRGVYLICKHLLLTGEGDEGGGGGALLFALRNCGKAWN